METAAEKMPERRKF